MTTLSLFTLQNIGQAFGGASLVLFALILNTVASPSELAGAKIGQRRESKTYTIDNQSPYQGMPIAEGRGKYPVIFEPLQNIQASRSTYKVTSFIDFEPYLQYFQNFEAYLSAFKASLVAMQSDPIMEEFIQQTHAAAVTGQGDPCDSQPSCQVTLTWTDRPTDYKQRMEAYKRLKNQCITRHLQACLIIRQIKYIANMTDLIDSSYQMVKRKFLRAIDYVADSSLNVPEDLEAEQRKKRSIGGTQFKQISTQDLKYLKRQLAELAAWSPNQNKTLRVKRVVSLFVAAGAAIGSLINSGQIKQIKENIEILQEATILQGQKIDELARYADLTAKRVRQHDSQIYRLQTTLLIVEEGLKQMVNVMNFQIYASYHVNVAQTIVTRLQMGVLAIEGNVDKLFEYLRIMTSHRATSAVISPVALRGLLLKIQDRMRSNPRLRLPYDPQTREIWNYYEVMKVTPIILDKMLVILLTIPVMDKSLELNIYRVHNLPSIPPGQEVAATYQLEGDYFAIDKHGVYVTIPTERAVQLCIESNLAICTMGQALYPSKQIKWCIYALFLGDESRINRDCSYSVRKVDGNKAISLGGFLWALSSTTPEQLQVRCLEETHVVDVQPPLQIVYLGSGCEGYSPSMYLPAKTEMTGQIQLEARKDYFLQFNFVFTPDQYGGIWWQFKAKLMTQDEAKLFIAKAEPLGTINYALMNRQAPTINPKYGLKLPAPPATMIVGGVVIVTLIGLVLLACYIYRMKSAYNKIELIKQATSKPISGLRLVLSRMSQKIRRRKQLPPATSPGGSTIETQTEAEEIHPARMTRILREVFPNEQTARKYAEHLDRKSLSERDEQVQEPTKGEEETTGPPTVETTI